MARKQNNALLCPLIGSRKAPPNRSTRDARSTCREPDHRRSVSRGPKRGASSAPQSVALEGDGRDGRSQPIPNGCLWTVQSALTVPTVTDRLVQGAIKNLLEPIFEATFWHVSYGFRPGRGCHGALEHIRMAIRPRAKASDGRRQRAPYQWVIEGDIKGCFGASGKA